MILPVKLPLIFKTNDIKMHRNFYNNLKGRRLTTDLKANLHKIENFDCSLDLITKTLGEQYEYRNSIKIFSKNSSALHIDGDNCINCLVNVDDNNSVFGTIVLNEDHYKLAHSRLHHGDLDEILKQYNITHFIEATLKPGSLMVFDSNYYHSFNCGNGTNLLVHKFKNTQSSNKLYDPIYME